MDKRNVNLTAKPVSFSRINKEFVRAKCYVCALGKNQNRTHISKDAADAAMSTLGYIPVVAHVMYDEDADMYYVGGHDREIITEGMNMYLKDLTIPYGVVVDDTFEYVDVVEKDGRVATYLTADVIIWAGRYPGIMDTTYSEDIYWNQSMEINVHSSRDLKDEPLYTDIIDYSYSCLTLLGKSDDPEYNTIPCFPSARVEAYQLNIDDDFEERFSQLKSELKELGLSFAKDKGGEKVDNEIKEKEVFEDVIDAPAEPVAEEPEVTETEPAPAPADPDVVNASAEVDDEANSVEPSEPVVEDPANPDESEEPEATEEPKNEFSATFYERLDALSCAFNSDDQDVCAWIMDADEEYAFYSVHNWREDTNYILRYSYKYDEVEHKAELIGEPTRMISKLITEEENAKLEAAREAETKEFESLKQFKAETEKAQKDAEIADTFANFADLAEVEEFKALVEDHSEMSASEIAEKCYAIRGKNVQITFSAKDTETQKIPARVLEQDTHKPDAYGGLFAKYGKK